MYNFTKGAQVCTTLRGAPQPAPGVLVRYYMAGPYRYGVLVAQQPRGQWLIQPLGRMGRRGWQACAKHNSTPRTGTVYAAWPGRWGSAHWRTCTVVANVPPGYLAQRAANWAQRRGSTVARWASGAYGLPGLVPSHLATGVAMLWWQHCSAHATLA